jgi:PPM family protein phosphatase
MDALDAQAVSLSLDAAGATDIGKVREHNEDHVLIREDLGLYLVADGAGGHNAGDVASALAARSIANYFGSTVKKTHETPEFDRFGLAAGARRLVTAVLKANRDVIEISKSSSAHRGMGTTIVAACFSPRSGLLHVAHAGDSRCYRLRAGQLELLTQDHSLINDVLEQRPELDEKVLERLPKHVVTRALGMEEKLRVAIASHSVLAGDRYLLCSDGLSGPVEAEHIAEALGYDGSPQKIASDLVDLANLAGGPDNIAALVLAARGPAPTTVSVSARALDLAGASFRARVARSPEGFASEPEILILGIEELDLEGAPLSFDSASDGLLNALDRLVHPKK